MCCKPFHLGEHPPDPLSLMRSRYSAYALDLIDYIMQTTDPEGPMFEGDTEVWKKHLHDFARNTEFNDLQILDDTDDTVTFHATLKTNGKDSSFTEKSRFVMKGGKWYYYGFAPDS